MAGHTISLYLKERGHDVLGFDKEKSKYVAGNAFNTDFLNSLVKEGNFDTIINCIGILNQFAEQKKAMATFLNSYLPHFLVEITAGTSTQVIHMSTDCVFSGKRALLLPGSLVHLPDAVQENCSGRTDSGNCSFPERS